MRISRVIYANNGSRVVGTLLLLDPNSLARSSDYNGCYANEPGSKFQPKYPGSTSGMYQPASLDRDPFSQRNSNIVVGKMERMAELAGPLEVLPPVDFCCAYGSSLLPNNSHKATMVDYILGVSDPLQWHSENLERNRKHYSNCMARLGPKTITCLADDIGAGVHFNPFVEWRDKRIKYGVVKMHDLAMDVLSWNRFYLSGRLQKPEFTEDDLYAKICSLSYMGDLRMLFAEDKNKVKNIVQGSFKLFQSMYGTLLHEYVSERLLKVSSFGGTKSFKQDCSSSSTNYLFSTLPWTIQRHVGGISTLGHSGTTTPQIIVSSKDVAAKCVRKGLRRLVMVSSTRQALSGLITTGGLNAAKYLGRKISKAWQSRIS